MANHENMLMDRAKCTKVEVLSCIFEPEEKAHSPGEEMETKLTEFGPAFPPESGKFLSFGPVESSVLAKQVPSCLPHGCSPAEPQDEAVWRQSPSVSGL